MHIIKEMFLKVLAILMFLLLLIAFLIRNAIISGYDFLMKSIADVYAYIYSDDCEE